MMQGRSSPEFRAPRSRKRVGVLEILRDTVTQGRLETAWAKRVKRHWVGIMPQAVSVWCRQLGHETFYAPYYNQADPRSLLPESLDVVFISSYSKASALTYALAKLFRAEQTLTVLGGPHARAYPEDSLRFFDLVVRECDKQLIDDILRDRFEPGSLISSGRPLKDLPLVEERLPEIKSTLRGEKPDFISFLGLLTSTGCPYTCDFCIDWNSSYQLLPLDRLKVDLHFLSRWNPKMRIFFHDPNFGIRFDEVLEVMDTVPKHRRNPYMVEASLSVLKEARLPRLRETNCFYVAPGIESWSTAYSNKLGKSKGEGEEKLEQLVDHFHQLHQYLPGLQANFIVGGDNDSGDLPVRLTQEFFQRLPFVMPLINFPIPFAGTPLHAKHRGEGRLLESLPLAFYGLPYLSTRMSHYDPVQAYQNMISIYEVIFAPRMLWARVRSMDSLSAKAGAAIYTQTRRYLLAKMRPILSLLESDRAFRDFHEGTTAILPGFYGTELKRRLGPYRELLSWDDLRPRLGDVSAPSSSLHKPGAAVAALGIP